jgi:hypothetical protein
MKLLLIANLAAPLFLTCCAPKPIVPPAPPPTAQELEDACGKHQTQSTCQADTICEWSDTGGCDYNKP